MSWIDKVTDFETLIYPCLEPELLLQGSCSFSGKYDR